MIARARYVIELPCRFQLVVAANPCPCGRGPESGACECPQSSIQSYAGKLSGALADRIDLTVAIGQPSRESLCGPPGETSAAVRERVSEARACQAKRLGPGRTNAEMSAAQTRSSVLVSADARSLLISAPAPVSGRGHDRVLRIARTIADLDGAERVETAHLAEAITLRGGGG